MPHQLEQATVSFTVHVIGECLARFILFPSTIKADVSSAAKTHMLDM